MTALEAARRSKGMTQAQLAEAAGLHFSTIYRLEARERTGEITTWRKLAKALGLSDYRQLLEV